MTCRGLKRSVGLCTLALALAVPHARAQQRGAQAGRRLESRHGPHFAFLRSRAFWWRMGVMGGAALADGITTEQLIRRGGYEQNPLMGRYPSSARMFTEGSAMEVTGAWLAWRESRSPDPRARWLSRLVPVAVAGMQVTLAVQNTRLMTSEGEHIAKTVRSAEAAP